MKGKLRNILFFICLLAAAIVTTSFALEASAQTQPITGSFSRNLTIGDYGSDVFSLQAILIAEQSLDIARPTGYFGSLTAAAVANWQISVGLPSTGYFGPLSRAEIAGGRPTVAIAPSPASATVSAPATTPVPAPALAPVMSATTIATTASSSISYTRNLTIGDTGADVSLLQSTLITKGYLQIANPTGYFGPLTSAAVAHWQAAANIPDTGYFGPLTRANMESFLTNLVAPVAMAAPIPSPSTAPIFSGGGGGGGNSPPQPTSPPVLVTAPTQPPVVVTTTPPALPSPIITSSSTIVVIPGKPTTPENLKIMETTTSTASLSWSASTEPSGAIAGYELYRNNIQLVTTTKISFTNIELQASTTYAYAVASYDAKGIASPASAAVKATTQALPLPPPSSTPGLNDDFGISVGSGFLGLSSSMQNQELDNMVSLGVGWIRFDMQWKIVQANNSSSFNWSEIDSLVAEANAHHLKILAILDYAPAWAAGPCSAGDNCPPSSPAVFAAFAKAAAQRYTPEGVSKWEIWNEPNNANFWGGESDCDTYTADLKAAYVAIKAVDPNAGVISGGLAPESTDGKNISPTDFLSCMYQDGGKGYFDAVGDHPYTYPQTPSAAQLGAWGEMSQTTPSLRSIMTANGDAGKRIWVTEFGAPTDGPDANEYVSEAQQAAMVTDVMGLYKTYSWGGPFFWYSLEDNGMATSTSENFFGLVGADGSLKPAYTTLQNIISSGL